MAELKIDDLKIDPQIFTFKFSCKCSGECCNYGVYTDSKEAENILSITDKIIPLLDETQSKNNMEWFEDPQKDDDFESGIAVGTQIINNKCTFLDKSGLCVLQKLALNEGNHPWKYKPLYCYLFPLTIFEGSLTIDSEHIDRLKTCNRSNGSNTTIFESCQEELRFFFGEEKFAKLQQMRKEYLTKIEVGIKDESD